MKPKPLPTSKPPGEDFFLWSIVVQSNNPFHDPGFIVFGSWANTVPTIRSWVLAQSRKTLNKTQILMDQGQPAREKLPKLLAEEIEFQRRRAQSDN